MPSCILFDGTGLLHERKDSEVSCSAAEAEPMRVLFSCTRVTANRRMHGGLDHGEF
jgi:hypothetical protein